MKNLLKLFVGVGFMCLTTFFSTHVAQANELTSPPLTFESNLSLAEITQQIENYYSTSLFRSSNKWKDSVVKHDGAVGQYITTYFWIPGSNIGYDIVVENYYSTSLFRSSNKWKDSVVKHDGAVGQYITTYFWIPGSNIGYDIVGQAQRKAIESKYGKVEKKYTYKMETTQHIDQTNYQTQGYITVGATAKCHDRK